MNAKELSGRIDGLFTESIVPAVLKIEREGGGDWSVTDTITGKVIETFSDYSSLKDWLTDMRAYDIPDDILQQNDVDREIPVDMVALSYNEENEMKCPECGSDNVEDKGDECECDDCGYTWKINDDEDSSDDKDEKKDESFADKFARIFG